MLRWAFPVSGSEVIYKQPSGSVPALAGRAGIRCRLRPVGGALGPGLPDTCYNSTTEAFIPALGSVASLGWAQNQATVVDAASTQSPRSRRWCLPPIFSDIVAIRSSTTLLDRVVGILSIHPVTHQDI